MRGALHVDSMGVVEVGHGVERREEMGKTVSVGTYGHYSSSNYGANTIQVSVGSLDLYFSYQTLVAFNDYQTGLAVHENDWGPTTGKHLNWIDGGRKKSRVSASEFEAKLEAVLAEHGLSEVPSVSAGAC